MQALARLGHERYRGARMQILAGMVAITALINAFYFLKIFPPLPLVLSDAGVYHDVQRVGAISRSTAEDEPPRWQALFGTFAIDAYPAGRQALSLQRRLRAAPAHHQHRA